MVSHRLSTNVIDFRAFGARTSPAAMPSDMSPILRERFTGGEYPGGPGCGCLLMLLVGIVAVVLGVLRLVGCWGGG